MDADAWRSLYAKILRCWAENFMGVFDKVKDLIGERRAYLWHIYLFLAVPCYLAAPWVLNRARWVFIKPYYAPKNSVGWDLPITRIGWLC